MKYHIILADPPWSYNDKKQSKTVRNNFGASKHYNCMNLNDIKSLHVSSIAEDNSVLFLWTTMPLLQESLAVIDAWGFTYKTIGFYMDKNEQEWQAVFWSRGIC